MNSFVEFVENLGVHDAEGTAIFVKEFLDDPGIFFQLS